MSWEVMHRSTSHYIWGSNFAFHHFFLDELPAPLSSENLIKCFSGPYVMLCHFHGLPNHHPCLYHASPRLCTTTAPAAPSSNAHYLHLCIRQHSVRVPPCYTCAPPRFVRRLLVLPAYLLVLTLSTLSTDTLITRR